MCGILNIINKKNRPLDPRRCRRALAKLYMRGPDFSYTYFPSPNIFLGQTVLSLVGEPKTGDNSYLWSKNKQFYISFNGEIYNYEKLHAQFLSDRMPISQKTVDTEILVNLWEVKTPPALHKTLDGMYAFSVFEPKNQKMYLGRDFQGEKTLYIFEDEEFIIISSQVDAIIDFTGALDLDKDVIQDYFYTRHFLQIERHIFKNIRQIRPGTIEVLDLNSFKFNNVSERTPFDLISESTYRENEKRTLEDLTNELDEILKKNVKEMVPHNRNFGSVISGGIDSSLLTAYACEVGNPSMLIGINHIGKDEISNQLLEFEKKLQKPITVLNVDWLTYSAEIPRCQKVLSGPLYSHSFVGQSLQSAHVRKNGCKALYGGEGADELFGGYKYQANLEAKYNPSPYSGFIESPLHFKIDRQEKLRHELETSWKRSLASYSFIKNSIENNLQAQMICDLYHQIPSVAMRGADLMSMMWGIETRSIFMRKEIVEFAVNLPLKFKIDLTSPQKEMQNKRILKELFVKKFTNKLLFPKQGFAGFPNESKVFLGQTEDFLLNDLLEIENISNIDRATEWKMINLEHFLRGQNGQRAF